MLECFLIAAYYPLNCKNIGFKYKININFECLPIDLIDTAIEKPLILTIHGKCVLDWNWSF